MTLSILIATIPKRADMLASLLASLRLHSEVEIITEDCDCVIGSKRNKLLSRATGEYIVFIDDDDEVSPDYIALILEACKSGSDCIGISGTITTNGREETQWHISKEYGAWKTVDGVHLRTPNHISPVRRELALLAGFPPIKFREDYEYSMKLLPLLRTETIVHGNIYHYKYISKK